VSSETAVREYLAKIVRAYREDNATEHTYRPELKALLEALVPGVTATNEPKRRTDCGAPDYVISRMERSGPLAVGYVEAKDIGVPLGDVLKTDQLKRYLRSLENLVLTDYVEFRWFVNGEHRLTASLGTLERGRVYINNTQYFEGVPLEVWEFHVGGYQVCEKWLKDRKGRVLTYDDLEHYQNIVAALAETIRLMDEIDEVIEEHGGWPIAGSDRSAEAAAGA